MKLSIKNMVCPRCIMVVQDIFKQLSVDTIEVRLGEVILAQSINREQTNRLEEKLKSVGFELLDSVEQKSIEQIKSIIINYIHHPIEKPQINNLSETITSALHRDYAYLSKLFSTTEGITIEQYMILQKIEKVKELITYRQKTLSEIAFEMNYSSVSHLSAQFKKITGLTPTQFKEQGIDLRQSLDNI